MDFNLKDIQGVQHFSARQVFSLLEANNYSQWSVAAGVSSIQDDFDPTRHLDVLSPTQAIRVIGASRSQNALAVQEALADLAVVGILLLARGAVPALASPVPTPKSIPEPTPIPVPIPKPIPEPKPVIDFGFSPTINWAMTHLENWRTHQNERMGDVLLKEFESRKDESGQASSILWEIDRAQGHIPDDLWKALNEAKDKPKPVSIPATVPTPKPSPIRDIYAEQDPDSKICATIEVCLRQHKDDEFVRILREELESKHRTQRQQAEYYQGICKAKGISIKEEVNDVSWAKVKLLLSGEGD